MRIAHPLAPFSLAAPRTAVSTRLLAIVALVAANIIWGTTFVATRPVLERVPPLTLASARLAIALLVLLPVLLLSGHWPILHRTTALMGFVGVFLAYACQNLDRMYTDASNGGSIPVITMLLAARRGSPSRWLAWWRWCCTARAGSACRRSAAWRCSACCS